MYAVALKRRPRTDNAGAQDLLVARMTHMLSCQALPGVACTPGGGVCPATPELVRG